MSATGGNAQEWQKEAFPAAMVDHGAVINQLR
jgi:hypothetical protein